MATKLKGLLIDRVDLVDRPANQEAHIVFYKRDDDVDKAEWTTAYINTLPDSAFAYISPGGEKDEAGKTTPRSLRHLPYRNANDIVDAPHIRNALARLSQTDIPSEAMIQARRRLEVAARQAGIKVGKRGDPDMDGWVRRTLTAIAKKVGLDIAKMGMYDEDGKPIPMTMQQMMGHKQAMDDYYKARSAFMESINSIMGMDDASKQADMLRKTTEEFATAMKAVMPHMNTMAKSDEDLETLLEDLDAADSPESAFDLVKAFDPEGRDIGAVPPLLTHKLDKRSDGSMDLETILKGLPEDQRKIIADALTKSAAPKPDETVTKRLDELTVQVQTFAKAAEDAKTQLAKAEAQNTELAKSLEAEKEIRVKAEYRKRADELRPLGLSVDEAADLLRKADGAGIGEMLAKQWQAEKAALQEAALFTTYGKSGQHSDGNDAWGQIEKQAGEMVIKSGGQLTQHEAVAKFLETPEGQRLYVLYESEKGGH